MFFENWIHGRVYNRCKEGNEMVELKGSEKQVKWAEEIRENLLVAINDATEFLENVQKSVLKTRT